MPEPVGSSDHIGTSIPRKTVSLADRVYDELRQLAARHMARESDGHTLQPTALVHEAYMRLSAQEGVEWKNPAHLRATLEAAYRHPGLGFVRVLQRCPTYTAALFDDLNPSAGGIVSWRELPDRAVATWESVAEYSTTNANTFQIEMFKTIERWIEFAREEIDEWPTTRDLGMTPRTEALTRLLAHDQSPLSRSG